MGLMIGVVLTVLYFSLATFFAVNAKALNTIEKGGQNGNKRGRRNRRHRQEEGRRQEKGCRTEEDWMSRRRLRRCPAHWPVRFAASQYTTAEGGARQTEDFESLARLAEDSIPSFKKEEERQFLQRSCTGLPPSSAWRSEESMVRRSRQDIAEYAVMLAAILVSLSARYGSLDQNCVTALQQHKVFETISVCYQLKPRPQEAIHVPPSNPHRREQI